MTKKHAKILPGILTIFCAIWTGFFFEHMTMHDPGTWWWLPLRITGFAVVGLIALVGYVAIAATLTDGM